MAKVKFDSIVAALTNGKREVRYHANSIQELIDDVKKDYPDLVFVHAKDGNENKLHGVFVDPKYTDMGEIVEAVNGENLIEYYYAVFVCDYNKLADLDPYIV